MTFFNAARGGVGAEVEPADILKLDFHGRFTQLKFQLGAARRIEQLVASVPSFKFLEKVKGLCSTAAAPQSGPSQLPAVAGLQPEYAILRLSLT